MRVKDMNPMSYHPNPLEDWVMRTFDELADQGPFGAGRVTLGFAFDLFFLPPETIKTLFARVKDKGVKTITNHGSVSLGNIVHSLKSLDLLDESIIISHGGDIKAADAELIKAAGAHLSSTPRTIPQNLSVEAAFNLATVKGAEAVNMSKEIGRIAEGYKADIVVFDGLSPSMVGAAQHDPVAAVILHSTPADIETVIIDGIIRKQNGKLLTVTVDAAAQGTTGDESLSWAAVAKKVVESRAQMQGEMNKIDFEKVSAALLKLFHFDESRLVDVA
jgi:hypothetical protein